MAEIRVNLPHHEHSYSIVIEPGLLAHAGERVKALAPHARCLLAIDSNIVDTHGAVALKSLRAAGYEVATAIILADEKQKTLAPVETLYRAMLGAKLERKSPVIALGGGITGDIAGFAAATYLRGVPLIHVPTSLLAMVDASIGGKTGVNFPLPGSNDLGKNLIGAFWQPRAVLIDPNVLATLPDREMRCGLAECIKHAMIADESHLFWLRDNAEQLLNRDPAALAELIQVSASIKAAIVSEDEREEGRRALLNLGHTFAHAIETQGDALPHKHGEAVAIGLVAAGEVALKLNRLSEDEQDTVIQTITACGLPLTLGDHASIQKLMRAMQFDKKVADGRMRLILPRGIGHAEIVEDVPDSIVRAAWSLRGADL